MRAGGLAWRWGAGCFLRGDLGVNFEGTGVIAAASDSLRALCAVAGDAIGDVERFILAD